LVKGYFWANEFQPSKGRGRWDGCRKFPAARTKQEVVAAKWGVIIEGCNVNGGQGR